ncbi:MAG: rhodanese-like domain-containing protein [Flavobacteriales bacterium]
MNRILLIVIVLCGITISSFTSANKMSEANHEQTATMMRDTPQQFSDAMNGGNFILLDVRTANEVAKGRIAGSIHIDWFADDFAAQVAKLDKSKIMLVYCASGGRSEEAGELLINQGFKYVHNLEGGTDAWKEAGYPLVK